MPKTDVAIGSIIESCGKRLRVVRRPYVYEPRDACAGCWFKDHGRNCYGYRCSKFDREDGAYIWFVEAE